MWKRKIDNNLRSFGEIDYRKKLIKVNKKKGDVRDTVAHEELHRIHPKMYEKNIYKKSKKMVKQLSNKYMRKYKKVKHPGELISAFNKGKSEEMKEKKYKNWIRGAIKKPGALHRALGIAQGKKIPAKRLATAAKKGGKMGKRARLAETLKGLKHKVKHCNK